jgi:hypothetical protein
MHVKAGLGLYHQPTEAPYGDAALGNPRLRPEEALHAQLGVAGTPFRRDPSIHFEATLFYKALRFLPVASDASIRRDGAVVPELYTDEGVGRVYGLELLVRRDLAPWLYGWIAYTLLRSERRDSPGGDWRLFPFDQTHVLTIVATARLPWQVSAGLRFRYATGNPSTPIASGVFLSDQDVYVPQPGAPFSTRSPAFNQLDLRIDKKFVFAQWVLAVYIDVENVYNQRNVEGYGYSFDYRRSATVSGLPILPALGVKGEF